MTAVTARVAERDLVEHYFDQPWSDGLPVVPPTPERLAAVLEVLGGDPKELVARIPPRWGNLTRELLAVNIVMAGCKPESAERQGRAMKYVCAGILALALMAADARGAPRGDVPLPRERAKQPYSPAQIAGFQPGDVLVRVEDTRVACSLDLERALIEHCVVKGAQIEFWAQLFLRARS